MTASYIFSAKGVAALAHYVAPDTLFAFDLDGTLAPIVEEYGAAEVAEPIRATLERLVNVAKVAVITGRSRKDALAILGFEPHLLVGNHGSEWPPQEGPRNWQQIQLCLKWQERLNYMLSYEQGVEIEFKEESVSLHYRKAADAEKALSLINAAIEKLDPAPRRIGGKFVVNLLPMEAFTKGDALASAMELFGFKRAIFIGDDVTDEDVFLLKNVDVFGIHIGKDDQTAAQYYLKKQSALLGLLNSMVGILESQRNVDEKMAINN
ncbi:MAG: trehalose-phosphatase [Desulfuromonadaceae bacterium]|nr:trehalose-phosphatase [Desulfuromonadaceae bacterium]